MTKRTIQRAVIVIFAVACLLFSMHVARTANATAQNKNSSRPARDADTLFAKSCATCHGKDGQAKTFKAKFNHARDLTDPQWQAEVSDERLFNSISNGKGKMPAWGKKFSEAEINSLVAYVRKLKR
jgi:mono/diheme cytochrome c family protein